MEFRVSNYLGNFIGNLDLRILSSQFYSDVISKPSFIIRQLGSDVSWQNSPYAQLDDNEFVMDFSYLKQMKEKLEKDKGAQRPDASNLSGAVNKKENADLSPAQTELDSNLKQHIDFLYTLEQLESENKMESFKFIQRKNRAFFFLSVPNETLLIEVYQDNILVGYVFLPLANVNFGQNYYEEIISLLPETGEKILGDLTLRMDFYPISIKTDIKILGSIGSLDFDDISAKFESESGLFEACILMEKNIKESKMLIWPSQISNAFKNVRKTRRFILNLKDIHNLIEVYSKDINFNTLSIKVRINNTQQRLDLAYNEMNVEELKKKLPKVYYFLTQESYRQYTVEEETQNRLVFRINDSLYGVLSIPRSDKNHHFEFDTQHPKESLAISLYHNNKILDHFSAPLEGVPINEDVDAFTIPVKFPNPNKKSLDKKTVFLRFETMLLENEETKEFPSGVFTVQRMKVNQRRILNIQNQQTDQIYSKMNLQF